MLKSNTLKINTAGEVTFITFPKLSATNKVNHCFTTRLGGVSGGFYSSMNMSLTGGDDIEAVKENYRRICAAVGIDCGHLVLSHQTHTDNIKIVTKKDLGKGIWRERDYSDIDALITNEKGVALVTQYADCTPIVLLDPVKGVVAAVHAGWRGTVMKIGAKVVNKMVSLFGSNPADIIAGIGPSIGSCCYEVDDPVLNEFKKAGFKTENFFSPKANGRYMLDLWRANVSTLLEAGVKKENIDCTDICTCCNAEYLHSHRYTGGRRGTLAAIIELKE